MRMFLELIQSAGVKRIIRADKDKKIKFCCLQSKAAEPYMEFCGVEREDVLRRFVFVESPNSYHQGSAGNHLPLQDCSVVTYVVWMMLVLFLLFCSCFESFIILAPALFCFECSHGRSNSSEGCRL